MLFTELSTRSFDPSSEYKVFTYMYNVKFRAVAYNKTTSTLYRLMYYH